MTTARRKLEAAYQESTLNMAKYYNKKLRPMTYAIGNKVWLLGKNLTPIQLCNKVWLLGKNLTLIQLCKKLDRKYYGLFQVLGIVGKNAYQLELFPRLKIHSVFHISLLEPANKTQEDVGKPLPPLEVDGKEEYYVKDVLDSKYWWAKLYYLVKWRGYSKGENSWQSGENLENMQKADAFHKRYPDKPGPELSRPAMGQLPKQRQRKQKSS